VRQNAFDEFARRTASRTNSTAPATAQDSACPPRFHYINDPAQRILLTALIFLLKQLAQFVQN
jgi:hypothetical protein